MSLETLINGYKAVDQAVLKQYTRLGQHIPEEKLYKVTTRLGYTGNATAVVLNSLLVTETHIPFLLDLTVLLSYGVALVGDFYANILGLNGKLPSQQQTDSTPTIDIFAERMMNHNRVFRLPVFAIGATFLGVLGYDVAQDTIYDHFIPAMEYVRDSFGALSFLSSASSMYLKDQDPKLLDKQPSKVKAFVKGLYEKVKEKLSPSPTPIPVPVAGYSVLEESLSD